MQRQFNVYSPIIVVYENEKFFWTVTKAEAGAAGQVVVKPASGTWPLDQPSYTVTPSAPVQAIVTGNVGVDFVCSPPANNVATQKIITTPHAAGGACNAVNVIRGNYFIWLNEAAGPDAETQIITPDPANPNYWPLPQPFYAVPPSSWIAVQVPSDAIPGNYPLIVADKNRKLQCPQVTQPIIIVQGNGGAAGHKR